MLDTELKSIHILRGCDLDRSFWRVSLRRVWRYVCCAMYACMYVCICVCVCCACVIYNGASVWMYVYMIVYNLDTFCRFLEKMEPCCL